MIPYRINPPDDEDAGADFKAREERETLENWRLRKMLDLVPLGTLTFTQIEDFIQLSRLGPDANDIAVRMLKKGADPAHVLDICL